MDHAEDPEFADRPNKAKTITSDPIRTGNLGPAQSVSQPDSKPPTALSIASDTLTKPISSDDSP